MVRYPPWTVPYLFPGQHWVSPASCEQQPVTGENTTQNHNMHDISERATTVMYLSNDIHTSPTGSSCLSTPGLFECPSSLIEKKEKNKNRVNVTWPQLTSFLMCWRPIQSQFSFLNGCTATSVLPIWTQQTLTLNPASLAILNDSQTARTVWPLHRCQTKQGKIHTCQEQSGDKYLST